MTTETELDARLAAADRAATLHAHDTALEALFAQTERGARSRPRRRAFIGFGAAGVLTLGLGLAAPAAADVFGAYLVQVGVADCASSTECGNNPTAADLQIIDPTQPDFAAYVHSIFPADLPIAAGGSRSEIEMDVVGTLRNQSASDPQGDVYMSGGVASTLELKIYCTWVDQWISAHAAGDVSAQQQAAQVMREATTWRATVMASDGAVIDGMLRDADAADRGDVERVLFVAENYGCASGDGVSRGH
jgi:hypothetical protein